MEAFLFYLFASLVLVTAATVILHPHPLKGALALIACFFCLAGIYLQLDAQVVGAIQVLVYAGGIMVLFLFCIMLLDLREESPGEGTHGKVVTFVGLVTTALVGAPLVVALVRGLLAAGPESVRPEVPATFGGVAAVGEVLFGKYALVFEVTSVLLLVAIAGAVVIARGRSPWAD